MRFHELLQQDKPFLGVFLQAASPEFAEAAAWAGFSFAAVDLEHASFGTETMVSLNAKVDIDHMEYEEVAREFYETVCK